MRCVKIANSRFRMPTSGASWMFMAQRMAVIAKRRAYVKKCMRASNPGGGGFIGGMFGNFDGGYSNAAAPVGMTDPIVTNTTPPPPSNATIPGQPYTSIPRPGGPGRPTGLNPTNWGPIIPPRPVQQVPYHRHSIFDFEIKTGGPTRQKYYNPGYPPVLPPPRPIIPTPVKPGVRPGVSPGRPDLPAVPATRNFGGETTSWQDDINDY